MATSEVCGARDALDLNPGALHITCDRPAEHAGLHWDTQTNVTWAPDKSARDWHQEWPRGTRPDPMTAGDESSVMTLKARTR